MGCLLHVGFHKTASTWLQRHVFPRIPGVTWASGPGGVGALIQDLRLQEAPDWSPVPLRRWLADAPPDRDIIVSDEALSGEAWQGGFNWRRNAERLGEVFGGARVLILVREQPSMLRSFYLQHIHSGGFSTVEAFLDERNGFRLDQLRFDRVVQRHQEIFGASCVTVLPFEWLAGSPETFVETLCGRLGLPLPEGPIEPERHPNRSLSPFSREVLRFVNRHCRRSQLNPHPTVRVPGAGRTRLLLQGAIDPWLFRSVPRRLSETDELRLVEVTARYSGSNRKLQELTGLPLADLGYPL